MSKRKQALFKNWKCVCGAGPEDLVWVGTIRSHQHKRGYRWVYPIQYDNYRRDYGKYRRERWGFFFGWDAATPIKWPGEPTTDSERIAFPIIKRFNNYCCGNCRLHLADSGEELLEIMANREAIKILDQMAIQTS